MFVSGIGGGKAVRVVVIVDGFVACGYQAAGIQQVEVFPKVLYSDVAVPCDACLALASLLRGDEHYTVART